MALNKQQLEVVNQNNFPDNNEQLITPALLRDFNTDMIDSIQLTGSYATTGSNTFIGNQTITGNLTVSGVISASVLYVQTETASVIYSSGSNQFGDELTDTQTLSGSVKVQGSLTVNGTSVLTSSVGFVSTASFNAYTSSNNQRVSSLEVNSASVNISITNLNSFTASQSTLNGTFATTGSNTFTGNQIIDKTKALYTNALYWTSSEVGYSNLEIINQAGGNLDFASLNGGKIRIVNTPLILTGSALSSSNDISTSANIYGANITGSTINTGSLVTTASFNAYTQSNDIIVNALVVTTNAQQILIGNLNSATASLFTSTSLSLTTASFSGNTLTFTKGNGSTFGVVIPDISGSTIPSGTVSGSAQIVELGFATTASLNAYTASNNQRVDSLESNSASVNISISNINSTTASLNSSVSNLNSFSASTLISINALNTNSASVNSSITNLNQFTASQTTASIVSSLDNLNTFSASTLIRLTNIESTTASLNTSISNLNTATSSLFTSASLSLVTASFDTGTRNLTFTKGNTTQFSVNIPDVSGSGIPTGTVSSSAQIVELGFLQTSSFNSYTSSTNSSITQLNASTASQQISINALNAATSSYVTSAITASSLVTASFTGNTLTFTKGDATTFGVVIPDVSGSTINTGSLMVTGSVAVNVLTFTKGDGSTFDLTVAASGSSPAGTVSSSAQILNYNIFATTGSNTFTGNQLIGGYVKITGDDGAPNEYALETNKSIRVNQKLSTSGFTLSGSAETEAFNSYYPGTRWQHAGNVDFTNQIAGVGSGSMNITAFGGGILSLSGSQINLAGVDFIQFSSSVNGRIEALTNDINQLDSATASLFTSASLGLVTASFSGNTLTFTKGDTSTFGVIIPDVSGSGVPTGTVSSSAQIVAYNVFATTGSNNFKGGQNISSSANIGDYLGTDYVFISQNGIQLENAIQTNINFNAANNFFSAGGNFFLGNTLGGVGSGSITVTANNGGNVSVSGSQTNIAGIDFIPFSASVVSRLTSSAINNPTLNPYSGSLILVANTFTSSSFTHISASANGQVNLVFKNNNNSADTIISGSSNIFTNPATPTTGYIRYIGGSNNLYLNSTNGINSQITASAASVSGNRPTMNNNIFNGDVNFLINQAVNTGTHDYSHNKIGGTNATVTINALSHTGSVSILANTVNNAAITINAASASLAQIATGISGSGTVNVNSNFIQGGFITSTSPRTLLTTNTQSATSNVVAGGSITITNISSSAAVNSNNNFANSAISYTNAGAAGLGLHTQAGAITNNYGGGTIIASGSAVNFNFNTTSGNNLTVTNQAFSGSLGVGQFNILRNIFFGQSGTLLITGSVDGTGNTTGAFTDNAVIGKSNTIFSNQSGANVHNSFISNVVGGEQLIISASNSFNSTIGGGAYFGRYNANDGVRNKTGQTVFSVGTGTSSARKTGLLIDSGSNMFVEGTLNVSGSTTMTGSLIISSSNATELFVIGDSQFTGSVKVASTFQLNLPTGSNQQAGTAVLDGASPSAVVVSNSIVTANSIIMLTKQTLTNAHMVAVSSKGAGTFTITSNGNGDTDTVGWFIINNS